MAATPTLTLLSSEVSSVEPLWLDGSRGPVPDLVPRLEVGASKRRGEENGKVMESMFLLSILIIAVLWLYLFPPPSS